MLCWLRRALPLSIARFLFLVLAVPAPTAFADPGPLASLRGVITDPQGRVVAGALVEVSGAKGEARVTSNESGAYAVPAMAPGAYQVLITREGFSPYVVPSANLRDGYEVVLDVTLALAPVEASVGVEADAPGLSLAPSDNATAIVFKGEDLETLPDDPDELSDALRALAGPSAGPDGGLFIDGFRGGRIPPKESIREIRVGANPFSAEYGSFGASRIEILTKPGADCLHAQASFRISDHRVNARNPYVFDKVPYQRRDGSVSLGGPLRKSRLSFGLDAARRDTDDNALIHARTLDRNLAPVTIQQAVLTPRHRISFGPQLDLELTPTHSVSVSYTHTEHRDEKAGIGEYSLASRAYQSSSRRDTLSVRDTAVISNVVNELRLSLASETTRRGDDRSAATVEVADAFTGGGSQIGTSTRTERTLSIENAATWAAGSHTLRAGAQFRLESTTDATRRNYAGTVSFFAGTGPLLDADNRMVLGPEGTPILISLSSLERYRRTLVLEAAGFSAAAVRALGGGATQLRLTAGDPEVSIREWGLAPFIQDEWRIGDGFVATTGLRLERQGKVEGWAVAPRLAVAWSPVGSDAHGRPGTVLRGGVGLFYDRFDPDLSLVARREDGVHEQRYVVSDAEQLDRMTFTLDDVFGLPSAADLAADGAPSVTRRVAPGIGMARTLQTSLSVEQALAGTVTMSASYMASRASHLLRARNINAPLADGSQPLGADAGAIYQYESTGRLDQDQIAIGVNSGANRNLSFFARYYLTWAESDTDGAATFPASSYDLAAEYGPAGNVSRHRFLLGGSVRLVAGIRLSPMVLASSGLPFNITTGRDNNHDTVLSDRPAYATDPGKPGVVSTPYGLLDPNPMPGEPIIPRNLGRGPGFFMVNLRLSKTFRLGRGGSRSGSASGAESSSEGAGGDGLPSITVAVAVQNVFNRVNRAAPVGNLGSPFFNQSTASVTGFSGGGMGSPRGGAGNRRLEFQIRISV